MRRRAGVFAFLEEPPTGGGRVGVEPLAGQGAEFHLDFLPGPKRPDDGGRDEDRHLESPLQGEDLAVEHFLNGQGSGEEQLEGVVPAGFRETMAGLGSQTRLYEKIND